MKVMNRTGLSVALLFMSLFLYYAALLDARATDAQTVSGTMGGGSTSSGECPNAKEVATIRASPGENLIDQGFKISGGRVRVTFENQGPGFASVVITINDEAGDFVDSFVAGSEQQRTSLIVNQGPGGFSLEANETAGNGYTVTVEDCASSGQGDTNGDGEDTNNDGVIDNTIPKKPLPDTSGSTVLIVGGSALLLLYGGLVTWRLRNRER